MKKQNLLFFALIGLGIAYGILSFLAFISRGKWGGLIKQKVAIGTMLVSMTVLVTGLRKVDAQEANTPPPTPTPEITPMCYVPPAPTPTLTRRPSCYTQAPPTRIPPTPTPSKAPSGDVDNSGRTDIVDALQIAQHATGQTPSGFNMAEADVDRSGDVDIVDALCVAQKYVGLIEEYPDRSK